MYSIYPTIGNKTNKINKTWTKWANDVISIRVKLIIILDMGLANNVVASCYIYTAHGLI